MTLTKHKAAIFNFSAPAIITSREDRWFWRDTRQSSTNRSAHILRITGAIMLRKIIFNSRGDSRWTMGMPNARGGQCHTLVAYGKSSCKEECSKFWLNTIQKSWYCHYSASVAIRGCHQLPMAIKGNLWYSMRWFPFSFLFIPRRILSLLVWNLCS